VSSFRNFPKLDRDFENCIVPTKTERLEALGPKNVYQQIILLSQTIDPQTSGNLIVSQNKSFFPCHTVVPQ
jgi:hypothetical protein